MSMKKMLPMFILGCAIYLMGLPGCATPKKIAITPPKPVVEQIQTPREPVYKPEPAPQARVREVVRVEEKPAVPNDLKFGTIYFDFDASNIRSDQQPTLSNNARLLSEYKTVTLQIEGNCDERGTNEYNVALGQRRADAAKDFLIAYGIDRSRISTVSYGEERPVDSGHDETAWAKNRRNEFTIVSK